MVQSLTMLAIALHARHELAASDKAIARALQLAIDLGMHRREFARRSAWNAVQQESLRRTWWELYAVDGYLAALHHKSTFRAGAIVGNGGSANSVLLPCEEAVYEMGESGHLPPVAPSLEDFDNRLFSNDDDDDESTTSTSRFYSFTYRIDSVRLLSRVLAVTRMAHVVEGTSDTYAGVDSALAGWMHHLHSTKVHVVCPPRWCRSR